MLFKLVISSAVGLIASTRHFESLTSDPPHISQSGTAPDSDLDSVKTIVTLSVVFGVCVIVVIVLAALCCSNRAEIKSAGPPMRPATNAIWRAYTYTEDLSAASTWSESARSTGSLAGDAICPICHAPHVHAVDLGLHEPCARTCDFRWQ
jgi:hypothetical protein